MPDQDGWPSRRLASYALAILLIAYVFAFIDRIILSMLVGPIKQDLGFSDTQIALVNGLAFSVFYTVMGIPLGRLVDRTSRRAVIASGIAVWSLFTAFSGLARNFLGMFVARMGVGIGEAALSPGAYSMIADYFRPEARGRAIAIYTMGVALGSGLAYLIGGFLIAFASRQHAIVLPLIGETAPWRFILIAVGLPGLLIALLMMTVPEPPRRPDHQRDAMDGQRPPLLPFLKRRRTVIAAYLLGYGLMNISFSAFLFWGPAFLARQYGLGPAQIGVALGLVFLGPGIIGQFAGAAISDWRYSRGVANAHFQTGLVCALLLIPVSLFATLSGSAAVSIAMLAVLVFLVCCSVGHQAAVATLIAPNRLRGQVAALYILTQNILSQILANLGVALLNDYVFHDATRVGLSMAIMGALGAIGGVIAFLFGMRALGECLRADSDWRSETAARPVPQPR